MLNRIGFKQKIFKDIIKYFPPHEIYVEPFLGAGGVYFNKPLVPINYLNDIDDEVINLFLCCNEHYNDLITEIKNTPYHQDIINYWRKNKEKNKIKKAVRFIYISNFTLFGFGDALRFRPHSPKLEIIKKLNNIRKHISSCSLYCMDYYEFLKKLDLNEFFTNDDVFIYCDPPYVNTADNYNGNSFNEKDMEKLIYNLINMSVKFAVSHFKTDFTDILIEKYKLNEVKVLERKNLTSKKRQLEILITNYNLQNNLFI